MYYSKADLKGVTLEEVQARMSTLADELVNIEDELRMANHEWDLLSEYEEDLIECEEGWYETN